MLGIIVLLMFGCAAAMATALLIATGKLSVAFLAKQKSPEQKSGMTARLFKVAVVLLIIWIVWNVGARLLYGAH